jgi:hypothetical protein
MGTEWAAGPFCVSFVGKSKRRTRDWQTGTLWVPDGLPVLVLACLETDRAEFVMRESLCTQNTML